MEPKIWGEILNGTVQIVSLTPERIKEATSLLYDGYFPYETLCAGCKMSSNKAACDELVQLASLIAEDKVSLIAVEKATDKIIGVSINKLQVPTDIPYFFFKQFREKECQEANSKALLDFWIRMDAFVDIFHFFSVDCVVDIMFLTVHPDYIKKGIGKNLVSCSVSVAESLQDSPKSPKMITGIFTSTYSYKIANDLDFYEVISEKFSTFDYEGKWKVSDQIDCKTHKEGVVVMAKDL